MFPPAEFNNEIEDSTSAPNAPDIEVIVIPAPIEDHKYSMQPGLHGYGLVTSLLRQVTFFFSSAPNTDSVFSPTSVGSIQIRSADPWDHPVIDPKSVLVPFFSCSHARIVLSYLATQHDTAPLTSMTDVGSTHPLLDHHFDRLSDQDLGGIIRNRVESVYHSSGTCTMGSADNPAAVLDTQLRVRGALGLRVCDASVYPKLVSGHPVSRAIMRLRRC